MFERFTPRARRAVVLADEWTRSLDLAENIVPCLLGGTVDAILGSLTVPVQADSEATAVLSHYGMGNIGALREVIRQHTPRDQVSPAGHVWIADPTKKALEYSLRAALRLGCNYIGASHLLLGIMEVNDESTNQIFTALGVDQAQLRIDLTTVIQNQSKRGLGIESDSVTDPMHELYLSDLAMEQYIEGYEELLALGVQPKFQLTLIYDWAKRNLGK